MPDSIPPFITRVIVKNYKSIADCDVRLGRLTFLVGRNGAGKSNFLDIFRFVADALNSSLHHAIRERGGIDNVRRKSNGHPYQISISFKFQLKEGVSGDYFIQLEMKNKEIIVKQETCNLSDFQKITSSSLCSESKFIVDSGEVKLLVADNITDPFPPASLPDSLYLARLSGVPSFRSLFEALTRMSVYNFNPDKMREIQDPDPSPSPVLQRDGSNITAVIHDAFRDNTDLKQRLDNYLNAVVPQIKSVQVDNIRNKYILTFDQTVKSTNNPWKFDAIAMSDGTLRALGVIVAMLQVNSSSAKNRQIPFVAIEEPESAIHPAASAILRDVLSEGSDWTQVIVTSHSPLLLDADNISPEQILFATSDEGNTSIVGMHEVSIKAMKTHLYTAGELMAIDQLLPENASNQYTTQQTLDFD